MLQEKKYCVRSRSHMPFRKWKEQFLISSSLSFFQDKHSTENNFNLKIPFGNNM